MGDAILRYVAYLNRTMRFFLSNLSVFCLEKYPVVGKLLKPDEEPTDYSTTDSNNVSTNSEPSTSSKKEN